MTLAVRDVPTIAGGMVAQLLAMIRDLTDVSEGAVARSILETAAIEVLRLEVFAAQGVRDGIETGTFQHFDFYRLPATYASGTMRYSRASTGAPVLIAAGHRTRVPGSTERVYETLLAGILAADQLAIDLPVRCLTAGTAGNTAADTVLALVDVFSVAISVTNPIAILNGQDRESEAARFDRFQRFVAGLSKATVVSLEDGASRVALEDGAGNIIEHVANVYIHEPWRDSPRGHVAVAQVYIDNGSATASSALLAAVRQALLGYVDSAGVKHPGYVAAGIDLQVFGVMPRGVDVVARVAIIEGAVAADMLQRSRTAIEGYLNGLRAFQPVVHAEIIAALMDVDGILDAVVDQPESNQAVHFAERALAGIITVTLL